MSDFSKELCNEKHNRINSTLASHESRLNNHGERLDGLERGQTRFEAQIEHLVKQLESLVGTLQWILRFGIGTGIGFILWYIKSLV